MVPFTVFLIIKMLITSTADETLNYFYFDFSENSGLIHVFHVTIYTESLLFASEKKKKKKSILESRLL